MRRRFKNRAVKRSIVTTVPYQHAARISAFNGNPSGRLRIRWDARDGACLVTSRPRWVAQICWRTRDSASHRPGCNISASLHGRTRP